MEFKDIAKANESIRTTAIQGKEYAEVNQRIKAFRMCFPEGGIHTEMISHENGVCIFRACVGHWVDSSFRILGVGTAYEKEGSSFINKTSYIENCETSAVGRALGMAGFGIDTSVASAEEVQNAMLNQDKRIGPNEVGALSMLINETNTDSVKVCEAYRVNALSELTEKQWVDVMRKLERKKEKANAERSSQ